MSDLQQEELEGLQALVETLQQENASLQEEVVTLRQQNNQSAPMHVQLELERTKQQLRSAEEQLAQMNTAYQEQVELLTCSVQQYKEQLRGYLDANEHLKQQNSELTQRYMLTQQQVDSCELTNKEQHERIQELQERLGGSERNEARLHQQLVTASASLDVARQQLQQYKNQVLLPQQFVVQILDQLNCQIAQQLRHDEKARERIDDIIDTVRTVVQKFQ